MTAYETRCEREDEEDRLTPYMMRRVHISADAHQLQAAILEYRSFAAQYPSKELSAFLLGVADDCENELQTRAEELWR